MFGQSFATPSGWRRVRFLGGTLSDPGNRLNAPISDASGYDRIELKAGTAMTTAEGGVSYIVPLLSPSGRWLQWGEEFTVRFRLRWNTATAPDASSGVAAFLSIGDGATTIVNKEYLGGGVIFTGGAIVLRRIQGGSSSASGGGTLTPVACLWDIGFGQHTLANRKRLMGLTGSAVNISAERVGNAHETSSASEFPTGPAYATLSVCDFVGLAAPESIDLEAAFITSEAAPSALAVAR
jgi:hypothetical protein